jgi:hypothetical protein
MLVRCFEEYHSKGAKMLKIIIEQLYSMHKIRLLRNMNIEEVIKWKALDIIIKTGYSTNKSIMIMYVDQMQHMIEDLSYDDILTYTCRLYETSKIYNPHDTRIFEVNINAVIHHIYSTITDQYMIPKCSYCHKDKDHHMKLVEK